MKEETVNVEANNKNATVFNAAKWIRANCAGAHELRTETLQIVSSFTLMWNFFENRLVFCPV